MPQQLDGVGYFGRDDYVPLHKEHAAAPVSTMVAVWTQAQFTPDQRTMILRLNLLAGFDHVSVAVRDNGTFVRWLVRVKKRGEAQRLAHKLADIITAVTNFRFCVVPVKDYREVSRAA